MRIFVAGATGALGSRLVPMLVRNGHQVVGMTRSPERGERIQAAGAAAVVADGLDADAVMAVIVGARPDVVVHEMTSLAGFRDVRRFGEAFALTDRLRTEGTDHLLAAAREAGAGRFVAQSFAGWPFARSGGLVKAEDEDLDPDPPAVLRRSLEAIRHVEGATVDAEGLEGVVLRYGGFYGPGTSMGVGGSIVEEVCRRRFPIIGAGTGVWSFVHIQDAASATLAAVERGRPGIYHIVDDEPAAVSEWLPALAEAVGARPPRRVPAWMGRLMGGEHVVALMNEVRGASNAKAKRQLGWHLEHPSWREGFRSGLGFGERVDVA